MIRGLTERAKWLFLEGPEREREGMVTSLKKQQTRSGLGKDDRNRKI